MAPSPSGSQQWLVLQLWQCAVVPGKARHSFAKHLMTKENYRKIFDRECQAYLVAIRLEAALWWFRGPACWR